MLKRRGNFPYDFDAAYPAYPTPVMPPNYVHNPAPPPAIPPPAASTAPDASSAPVPSEPEGQALSALVPSKAEGQASSAPVPSSAEGHPSTPPHNPRRRTRPLQRASAQRNSPAPPTPDVPEPSHHSRKCTICNHPQREAIEDDFVNWINLAGISIDFKVPELSIRRHARATGLYDRRRAKYHAALDLIIEDASRVLSTGDTIIRAIRAASCIDDSGRWVEPPKRVIFTTEHTYGPALPPSPLVPNLVPVKENPILELPTPATNEAVLIDTADD